MPIWPYKPISLFSVQKAGWVLKVNYLGRIALRKNLTVTEEDAS